MEDNKNNPTSSIRKLIDLDKEVIKRLQIQAINKDYSSVKRYIESLLIKVAMDDSDE